MIYYPQKKDMSNVWVRLGVNIRLLQYRVFAISGYCNIGFLQYRVTVTARSGFCYIGLLHIGFLHVGFLFMMARVFVYRVIDIGFLTVGF
jgi:hypothetical protein